MASATAEPATMASATDDKKNNCSSDGESSGDDPLFKFQPRGGECIPDNFHSVSTYLGGHMEESNRAWSIPPGVSI